MHLHLEQCLHLGLPSLHSYYSLALFSLPHYYPNFIFQKQNSKVSQPLYTKEATNSSNSSSLSTMSITLLCSDRMLSQGAWFMDKRIMNLLLLSFTDAVTIENMDSTAATAIDDEDEDEKKV